MQHFAVNEVPQLLGVTYGKFLHVAVRRLSVPVQRLFESRRIYSFLHLVIFLNQSLL